MKFKSLLILKRIFMYSIYGLSIQFLLCGLLLASSNIMGQKALSIKEIRLSVNFQNDNVLNAFEKIEAETEFSFVYLKNEIDRKLRLNAGYDNISMYDLLISLSGETGLGFQRVNNNINVKHLNNQKQYVIEEVLDDVNVTGKVTDESNTGLPGVNITIKGTSNGTITDASGNFSILAPDDGILVFSYIGYETSEVDINGRSVIDVSMTLDLAELSEVVVIGYGTQKRSDLTGALGSITQEEIQALTISNPTLALQGRVAGVNVQSNGGAPGAGVSVVIRGAGTINGSLDPLYVVDGVFLEDLSSVNPNDIQSMEILKDASAAAIYGSRAANGVVIITTSRGTMEGLTVKVHSTIGVSNSVNKLDFLNARQYADVRNEIDDASNAPRAPVNSTAFDSSVDTDWQDLSLRSGVLQDYGFSVAGGGKNSSVYFSANYFKERGIVISSDFDRINFRLNSEFWSNNEKFRISQSLALTQKNLNANNSYGNRYNYPTLPFQDGTGNFVAPSNTDHGVAFGANSYATEVTRDDNNTINDVYGNMAIEYKFIPGLTYKLNLGLNFSSEVDYLFVPTFFWSTSNQGSNQNLDADLTEMRQTRTDGLVDNILSYSTEINKHSINAVIGSTFQKIETRFTEVQAFAFPSDDLRVLSAAESVFAFEGDETVTGLASLYGRLIYSYDDKYLLTSTLRQDKSSRFDKDFRTGYFPSVSAGWRISREDFFPSIDALSDLKLRASYGVLGSQNVEDYAFTPTINLNSNYDFGDVRTFGVARTQFRLNNLVWEKSETTNLGVDAGFLNGKLQASIDYYVRKTDDILLSLSIPQTSGSRQPVVTNVASIENKGIELNLNYRKAEGEFTYDVNFNMTSTNNEVTSLGESSEIFGGQFSAEGLQGTRASVGEQLGVFWGFETDGLYQSQQEIDNDPNLSNNPAARTILKPGDLIYVDQNGDGLINDDDRVNIGNPYPDFDFGLNFNASYKNFDFTLFFQGQVGNDILYAKRYNISFESRSNYTTDVLNSWSETNTDSKFPVVGASRFDVSDFYIEDGGFLRLKQLRIGYNMKGLFGGSTDARIFVSGQNLLTLSGYPGYDPEVGFPGNTDRPSAGGPELLTRGVDLASYPQQIVVTGGVQFTIK